MRRFYTVVLAFFLLLLIRSNAFAASSYVLPYPGIMPGNKLYTLHVLWDDLMGYFAFGDFAQFKYNLSESDKYLVEAKTLFEYNQYPLAVSALEKSGSYFKKTMPDLVSAKKNGKDISDKKKLLQLASEKHKEVLEQLAGEVPQTFEWRAEKRQPVLLNLRQEIQDAINATNL